MRDASRRHWIPALATGMLLVLAPTASRATHAWGNYHWARSANPLLLDVGDDVSSQWDGHLSSALGDWNRSDVLDTSLVAGQTNPKNCKSVSGRVEVCNSTYGNNGWLGLASIWASGDHITAGTVKLNDTYFNTATYDTAAWRQLVVCQEVGHTFGLDHQDETFDNPNLGTCMDYTNDPDGTIYNQADNTSPNKHDYDELDIIYSHLDGGSGGGGGNNCPPNSHKPGCNGFNPPPPAMSDISLDGPGQWGRLIRRSRDGRLETYVLDFGHGHRIFTFVVWAEPRH